MGNHENTREKLRLSQEQLALAGDKILSLERSLNLYGDKYQTSLSNIELLECQVKMLEGELSRIVSQILKHLQEQKDSQCSHVEEYQNLVKDLRTELEAVSEQKKNIMKDMLKLELDLHGLREETSAHVERKDKEVGILQQRLQELQVQFTETQKLDLKKDKLLQEKDEMLHKLEKDLAQVKDSLVKKELELEKQQRMTSELEIAIQERQDKCKAKYRHLGAEIKKLKDCLKDAKQQHRMAAQQAAQYKEEAILAKGNLEDCHRKLQSCICLEKQKAEIIQELQRELQKLQKDSLMAEEELTPSRKRIEELTSELSEFSRKLEISEKEKRQLQKTVTEQDVKLNDLLDRINHIQHQNRKQASSKCSLEEQLQEETRLLEEKREQLKKSKEKEKLLEQELEMFRQEEKKKEKMSKESLRKLEEENDHLKSQLKQCSAQLDSSLCKQNSTQQINQELTRKITLQKETMASLQIELDKAAAKEKQYLQTTVSKEVYEEVCRKSASCQDDLTQALDKLSHSTSETKSLHRSLTQAQDRKIQLEEEVIAYEERMKKLNVAFKKLQGLQQESELEVQTFNEKLEIMSNEVLQWQKQHQSDLKMLAAKEEQLRVFQEEMRALKENLLVDERESCCLHQRSAPKDTWRLHRENDQIMSNLEQWAKEQKIANEKLRNKLHEQVIYIAKLTGEKDHLHNVMVHLQKENKKLKNEIEEKKLKAGPSSVYTKALCPSKTDPTSRGKVYGTLGWRGITQDVSQRMDITKSVGMPHCSECPGLLYNLGPRLPFLPPVDSMVPPREEVTCTRAAWPRD
ncbi:polyamine-modulated factor 1-binding protein 1 [Mesoplodon densirostris]|uniref:polyamine-modulated factor 1-binding protein 1 n=1 Tax=Mesoplodon densirostris TaxID=48708 RepID=UPI0028DB4677|nr:polyamine-modulated factor 1-binding protein 1 [Mesoplodon densirostris]